MPETWVERIAAKQTDFQLALEKLRQKYAARKQPAEQYQQSDLSKFESLFPEFRQVDKTQHPEVSPAQAFQPYKEATYTPFQRIPSLGQPPEVQPTVTKPPIITKLPPIAKPAEVAKPASFFDVAKVFGQALTKVPRQLGASILQAVQGQGGASVVNRDWADRFIEDASRDIEQFIREVSEKYRESTSLIKLTDIAQLPQNISYSLTSMGAGLAAGIPIGSAPIPGARVAAWGAGTAASGAVAYSMTTYQIMQQYLEVKNEESIKKIGKGISVQEEERLKKDFDNKAREYGLWEAVPEAISNLAFAKILTAPLTSIVGRGITQRIIGKLTGIYGEELLTETITQKGQSAIEVEAGLREGNIGWAEAFKEIAPQTFLLTTIMAGAGQGGVSAINKARNSLKNEIGEEHPLYKGIESRIKEAIEEARARPERGAIGGEETPESKIKESISKVTPPVTEGVTPTAVTEMPPQAPQAITKPVSEEVVPSNQVTTVSGRILTAPKIRTTTSRVAKIDSLKADAWLLNEAKKEVASEPTTRIAQPGSPEAQKEYQRGLLDRIKPLKMTQADKDTAWGILTGEPEAPAVFELVGEPTVKEKLTVAPKPSPEAPRAKISPVKEKISPQAQVSQLAEQVKAKLEAEPVVKPPAPKSPVERRAEIQSLLKEPAKNLPTGTTKITLRKELAEINKSLIPQEKKLRSQIMVSVRAKSLGVTQSRDIFRTAGGSRYLTNLELTQLEKVLKAVQRARPKKIGGKTVITPATEQAIKDTKAKFIESGKLKEADYPAILRALRLRTDKYVDSQNFITDKQGRTIIKAMRRKSLFGFATIEERIGELVTTLGPPKIPPTPISKTSFDVSWPQRVKDRLDSFLTRTFRVERILDKLDAKDNGPLWSTFYKTLNEATSEKVQGQYGKLEEFRQFTKENNIDIGKLMSGKSEVFPDTSLTPSEKIGVYLHSLNDANLRHLTQGNKFTPEQIEIVKSSITEEEQKVADWLHSYFANEYPAINEAKLYVTDEPLGKVENYFPIRLEWRANPNLDYWEQIAKEDVMSFATDWASAGIQKGFVKERTVEAAQAVDLDAMGIFLNHLEAVEHYKAFAPVIADLQLIMKNNVFKSALINKAGRSVYQVMDIWLKQVAETNPMRPSNQAEAFIRTMRVNATTAVLGLNITTALKQFPSFVSGATEEGIIPAMRGLFTYLAHPVETRQLIKQYSPQIYKRSFEREIAEAEKMRGTGKVLAGKLSPRQVFMIMTSTMDRTAVSALWRGSFEDGISKGKTPEQAAADAEMVIRKTQPFFDVKDLPEYYRSGEFMKALTVFTNQLNNYWNYYHFDIAGKYKAGRISKLEVLRRILLAFVIPALMIGAITRSRLPKDAKEVGKDLISMAVATVPIAGSWITSGMKGFTDSSLITTELASEIARLSNKVSSGKWDTMWEDILTTTGYATGVPVAQPKRTFKAMVELATGKTDDWLKLIWGEYARKLALVPLEESQKSISESISKLGEQDDISRAEAVDSAIKAGASKAKLREINAKDWTYDTTSLRRDIGDATRNLSDKDKAKLEPIASNYVEFKEQKTEYDLLGDKEQEQYVEDNPDFLTNRLFWGELIELSDLKTAEALETQAKKYDIPLDMIPAFQLTEKGKERIPSNKNLWEPYFAYYDLPGTSYLNMSQDQVDAGELPFKYSAEWRAYHRLKTDAERASFRKAHEETAYSNWREDFRQAHPLFDLWLVMQGYNKPLAKSSTQPVTPGAYRPFVRVKGQ